MKYCYCIIDEFINRCQIPGDKGIFLEHNKISKIIRGEIPINNDIKSCIRYGETAYLIWALTKIDRLDILSNSITNWGSGEDDLGNSHFRNFEFECHTALRFLEEGFDVSPIMEDGKPEFSINNKFVIECKRPTKIEGIFYNTLKARKQIDTVKKEGILFFNLDDLEGFKPNLAERIDFNFRFLGLLSEYGMGVSKTYLTGVIFEYLNSNVKTNRGSYIYALGNEIAPINKELAHTASKGICGHKSLLFDKNCLKIHERYPRDYSKREKELMKTDIHAFISKHFI